MSRQTGGSALLLCYYFRVAYKTKDLYTTMPILEGIRGVVKGERAKKILKIIIYHLFFPRRCLRVPAWVYIHSSRENKIIPITSFSLRRRLRVPAGVCQRLEGALSCSTGHWPHTRRALKEMLS